MKEFEVIIEETCSQKFKVLANSEEEVFDIAKQKYRNGEFVLEPGELINTCIATIDEDGETSNFIDI